MKKAELSFNVVISAIIVLMVVIVLVIVFNKQLANLIRPVTDIISNVGGDAGGLGK